jgi:hypothetical protein
MHDDDYIEHFCGGVDPKLYAIIDKPVCIIKFQGSLAILTESGRIFEADEGAGLSWTEWHLPDAICKAMDFEGGQ